MAEEPKENPAETESDSFVDEINKKKEAFVKEFKRREGIIVASRGSPFRDDVLFHELTTLYGDIDREKADKVWPLTVAELFDRLTIPPEKLKDVYEYDESIKELSPWGGFRLDGKQKLADILGKTITFFYSPEKYVMKAASISTYKPGEQRSEPKYIRRREGKFIVTETANEE